MSIGILIITHPGVGSTLLATASRLIQFCPTQIRCLEIPLDMNMDIILQRANKELSALDDGEGVLILTDAYGATPCNIACQLLEHTQSNMVSGINLPMLIRVFNYFTEDLETLANKAVEGGTRGIQLIKGEHT